LHLIPVFTLMTKGCLLLTHLFSLISIKYRLKSYTVRQLFLVYIFVAYSIGLPSSYLA